MVAEPDASSGLNRTLPSRYYYNSHIFEQEKERIFYDAWICAARTEEIPHAGDYLLREVVDESILVVRTRSGEVKAFCKGRSRPSTRPSTTCVATGGTGCAPRSRVG